MNDIQRKKCDKVVEFADEFKRVKKWGPKADEANFIQQTKNCLHCCSMAIQNLEKIPKDWDVSLSSDFICTLDKQANLKRPKNHEKLMPQKFWMFHRVDKQEIYVVFPSQEISAYILVDSNIWMMPKQKDTTNVDNIPISFFKALILRGYNLVFTGHSLGGALAILVTCKLVNKDLELEEIQKIRCIAFGAPQVPYTNPDYMLEFKNIIYRYELPDDPVPELLTAFQTTNNKTYQEFLVNLMNLLGIHHSFRNTPDIELDPQDYVKLNKYTIQNIKKYSELGTVFIPKNRQIWWSFYKSEFEFEQNSRWKFLEEQNQKEVVVYLRQFLNQLKGNHKFESYEQEILKDRIACLGLPKIGDNLKNSGMATFHLPASKYWIQGPEDYESHRTQIVSYFEERFTKVVLSSTLPHVFGVRFAQVQEFTGWGIESAKVIKDRQPFEVEIIFYSAQDYTKLKEKKVTTLSVSLQGYFESVENIKVNVEENTDDRAGGMRNLAYKNINVQQLYTSAFQACLFAGEGHNPMLVKDDLPEEKREALLREDRNSLVEILGSLIVNQELFKIISQETNQHFHKLLADHTLMKDCNAQKGLLSAEKIQQLTAPITIQAQKEIDNLYNKFEFTFTKQESAQRVQDINPQQMDATDCVTESIPILFCLSSLLVWQMKIYFNKDFLFTKAIPSGPGVLVGGIAQNQIAALGPAIATGAAAGLATFAAVGVLSSMITIRNKFINYIQNYETMQVQYRQQLVILVRKLGFQVKESHSIADLEKIVAQMCEWLLKQDEIGYEYEKSENQLNKLLLERIFQSKEIYEEHQEGVDDPTIQTDNLDGSDDPTLQTDNICGVDDPTIQTDFLQQLIERKVNFLSHKKIFENCDKDIKLHPTKYLAALLIFVWNNYRMRLCLSKTWRIGIMGTKNAGKSSLARMLGCQIPHTGENHPTEDATLYQNVPAKNFCVIDFPHLDNVEAKDCMRMFYSLADIAIIVLKSQEGASEEGKNEEVGQIIQAMKMKYGNLGFGNRKFPILLLLNQVDKMVFNENGEDPNDEELKKNFKNKQDKIFNNLKTVGVEQDQLECVFTSLLPTLPEPPQEKLTQWLKDVQNNKMSQKEYNQKIKQGDKNQLQKITNCSFFKIEKEAQQNENSIVDILKEMLQNLGDKDEANSLRAVFADHEYVVVVNTPKSKNN